jgi:hypothetical protein
MLQNFELFYQSEEMLKQMSNVWKLHEETATKLIMLSKVIIV